jgi:hypothetical protein
VAQLNRAFSADYLRHPKSWDAVPGSNMNAAPFGAKHVASPGDVITYSLQGFVVVVVVVSSCLITAGGWLSTTFRTTTRSPSLV